MAVKESNKRIMNTLPRWLIEDFQHSDFYKVDGGNNLSQSIRLLMLSVLVKEEIRDKKKVNS